MSASDPQADPVELEAIRAETAYLAALDADPAADAAQFAPGDADAARAYWQAIEGLTPLLGEGLITGDPAGTTHAQQPPPPAVRSVAGYRLVRELGHGGMGVVYEAEQHSPQRAVALKVVRGGAYVDEQRVRMFQREAQALARLKHPAIAAIYEAGRTADGQHFFALELVRGQPISDYVRGRKCALRERLALFCAVCEAVNYAHQRGVMHRDLKPSNILVDHQGRPKILDFGLARITDADVTATSVVSELGQIVGTLAYMSPEQARGDTDEIDLRTDVYALGVLLYELLTDQHPYDVDRANLPEAIRVICEYKPRNPSSIVPALRGDLQTITLKALEKEPARRYQNAAALSEDIQRYLTDRPILARPPSAVYQLRKLVARHRGGCGALACFFALIVGFAVCMSLLYARADESRRTAEMATTRADAARDQARLAAESEAQQAAVAQQQKRKAEEVQTTLLGLLQALEARGAEDQPPQQRTSLPMQLVNSGRVAEAEELARLMCEIRQRELGATHPDTQRAKLELARVLQADDRLQEAQTLLSELLDTQRRTTAVDPGTLENTLIQLAQCMLGQKKPGAAEPLLHQCLQSRRQRLSGDDWQVGVAESLLGECFLDLDRRAEARESLTHGYRLILQHLDKNDPIALRALDALARFEVAQRNFDQADKCYTMLKHSYWVEPPTGWRAFNPGHVGMPGELVNAWSPGQPTSICIFVRQVSSPETPARLIQDEVRFAAEMGAQIAQPEIITVSGVPAASVVRTASAPDDAFSDSGPTRIVCRVVYIPRSDDCLGLLLTTVQSEYAIHQAEFQNMLDTLKIYGRHGTSDLPERPANLDFEEAAGARDVPPGWGLPDAWPPSPGQGYAAVVDLQVVHSGRCSARLQSTAAHAARDGPGMLAQCIAARAFLGQEACFNGYLRPRDVRSGGYGELWIRVDGPGEERLEVPSANAVPGLDRGEYGTKDWSRHELRVRVPDAARSITFGVRLFGTGTIWADDLRLEPVRLEPQGPAPQVEPGNLPGLREYDAPPGPRPGVSKPD